MCLCTCFVFRSQFKCNVQDNSSHILGWILRPEIQDTHTAGRYTEYELCFYAQLLQKHLDKTLTYTAMKQTSSYYGAC